MAWRLGGIKDDTHTWTVLIGVLALSIFFRFMTLIIVLLAASALSISLSLTKSKPLCVAACFLLVPTLCFEFNNSENECSQPRRDSQAGAEAVWGCCMHACVCPSQGLLASMRFVWQARGCHCSALWRFIKINGLCLTSIIMANMQRRPVH